VLSPEDRPGETRAKIEGYLVRGSSLSIPDDQTATVFRPGAASVTLESESADLDLSDVIPGFSCHLREIFQ
jgi:hypothetical protein